MTKQNHKQAIRAYMAEHGVNYTTARRNLAISAAFRKIVHDMATNARANSVPAYDPSDLAAVIKAIAEDEAVLGEHTLESPISEATTRNALMALHHQYDTPTGRPAHELGWVPAEVHDLASVIGTIADDELCLSEHTSESPVPDDHVANALRTYATLLTTPHTPKPVSEMTPIHHLIVTANDPTNPALLTYTAECPGLTHGCEGLEECGKDDEEDEEELEQYGIAHGLEHTNMHFGWALPTGQCALVSYQDQWIDSATNLGITKSGRYPIQHTWYDYFCRLDLITENPST